VICVYRGNERVWLKHHLAEALRGPAHARAWAWGGGREEPQAVTMIVEKPMWLRHAGLQIFSLDIQPNGLRFATAGGDHKVRIWNMKPLAERDADLDSSSANKLLATLRDHFGSVNCVRWAKCGRLIASGSDDQVILVHERRPGSGTTEFGSGEPPDVENWKVLLTLRGHTADV